MENEKQYEYIAENYPEGSQPTELHLEELRSMGWEQCDVPDGEIGRDLDREPNYPHHKVFFRKEVKEN